MIIKGARVRNPPNGGTIIHWDLQAGHDVKVSISQRARAHGKLNEMSTSQA